MIKYNRHKHAFSCDNDSSNEMPSIEDLKKDKYGNVICRMMKHLKGVSFGCMKWNGKVLFGIDADAYLLDEATTEVWAESLAELFIKLTKCTGTPFTGKSYHEVLVCLDLMIDPDEKEM